MSAYRLSKSAISTAIQHLLIIPTPGATLWRPLVSMSQPVSRTTVRAQVFVSCDHEPSFGLLRSSLEAEVWGLPDLHGLPILAPE